MDDRDDRATGAERDIDRRSFLRLAATAGAAAGAAFVFDPWLLEAAAAAEGDVVSIPDPMTVFPDRGWEQTYRDLYTPDDTFVFLCAPNDTHNCLLRAHVKNGVVVRIAPTYGYGKATDLAGNAASHRWDPRCCQKGLALARRFYGDRRVRGAMVRAGFKEWVEAGFPRDPETGEPEMDRSKRGEDAFVKVGWDEAFTLAAKTYENIAETYSGEDGAARLERQAYDPDMIEAMHGAGTQTLKLRGGMPLLGPIRLYGFYRFANMLALLDARVRGVDETEAVGARGWDSYTWHTDLPPGHPMVTGQQTIDYDLFAAEHADLVVTFGMNWISTKMPEGHWLAEARLKGTRIITVTTDYQSTSNRANEVIMIRPATDGALALGCVQHILSEGLYDPEHLVRWTDLPLLVRLDDGTLLRAADVVPGYRNAPLSNYVELVADGAPLPPPYEQGTQYVTEGMREEWGDFVVWRNGGPAPVTRDELGELFDPSGVVLDGAFDVTTVDGKTVPVRTVFSAVSEYLAANFDLQTTSEVTWAPPEAIVSLATQVAAHRGKTLLTHGMGPNHFFNADLFDRAVLLLAAVTDNIGHIGGNAGSYAGNYRVSHFNGLPFWLFEDPFHTQLDPDGPVAISKKMKTESAHYYNYGDRPLRVGSKNFTGTTHMPTPTKLMHFANSNSLLGNAKGHHGVVANTLPRIEAIFVNEWWWNASCEYADIVFGVDSWGEPKFPDIAAAVTNPFLSTWVPTPLERIHDTRGDVEVHAGIAAALSDLTGDRRFADHWRFVGENNVGAYIQRIFDASTATRGYAFADVLARAREGVPSLMSFRTYPRQVGWEQRNESKPWYNRTGRLEFYRDEPEWLEYGENLPVFREPVDATPLDPNSIHGKPHVLLNPKGPEIYGIDPADRSSDVRQVRSILVPWSELKATKHPLSEADPAYRFIFLTPKYRHGAHTTPIDLDWMATLFGPFGDMYRHDKRKPWVGEGYFEINPADARELGIEDGDYVWFDADPEDRPYRGWKADDAFYDVSRGMARARYNNAIQPGVLRMWFNMYVATKGSVRGQREREDGLAKNPDTNYQSFFRHGSHQSATRAWLRPTLMTDTMTRKPNFGQLIGQGAETEIHVANGAPKESFVKIEKAEDGGIGGEGLWRPAAEGLRPTYESAAMKKYLAGGYTA